MLGARLAVRGAKARAREDPIHEEQLRKTADSDFGRLEAGHPATHASAGSHLHTPLESTGWVWWLQTPQPSPIPTLVQAAQTWREEVVKQDSRLKETPIGPAVYWALIQHLKQAIQGLGEDGLKEAKTSGWLNE